MRLLSLRCLFDNPYLYSGTILARVSVCLATLIWSFVVLIVPDAIVRWPTSSLITQSVGENNLAFIMAAIAGSALARMLAHCRPMPIGGLFYAAMAFLWIYSFSTLMVALYQGLTIPRPGQIAAIFTVAATSIFAFVSNPRTTPHDHHEPVHDFG